MDKSKIEKTREIIAHANCADGIGAATICTFAFCSASKYMPPVRFVQYGTKPHETMMPDTGQLFVDITPPKTRWEEWKGMSPIILDHHVTVKDVVESLDGVYGDGDQSGATLAFTNIFLPLVGEDSQHAAPWARFAHLCMIRDTWKTDSPDWYEACKLAHGILSRGKNWMVSMATSRTISNSDFFSGLEEIGDLVYDKLLRTAKSVTRNALRRDVSSNGKRVKMIAFNISGDGMSDVAHCVMEDSKCDIVIGYFYACEDNKTFCVVSIRTNGTISASKISEQFGGGGHPRAAGFKLKSVLDPDRIVDVVSECVTKMLNEAT